MIKVFDCPRAIAELLLNKYFVEKSLLFVVLIKFGHIHLLYCHHLSSFLILNLKDLSKTPLANDFSLFPLKIGITKLIVFHFGYSVSNLLMIHNNYTDC